MLESENETPATAVMAGVKDAGDEVRPDLDASKTIQTEQTTEPSRIGMIASLDDLPDVARYLQSVGATAINFRTAKVEKTENGYPRTVGHITFAADGAITLSGKIDAPTDEAAERIKAAFARVEFPKPTTLTSLADSPPGCDMNSKNTFVCHDFAGRVAMIQERYKTDDGKGFRNWTRWSDGLWRNMEPDVLPFFGLPGAKDHSTLVIHEGAKAAARVRRVLVKEESTDRFPWHEEMRWAAHIGWQGGVWCVERSDWDALAKMGWKKVIIIADNDDKGFRAARQIAKHFPRSVHIAAFDQCFKEGFDCGDDWPEALFDGEGRYSGPTLNDCLRPATAATLVLPPEGRGRPVAVIRREFAEQCAYTVSPPRFIFRHHPSRDRSADAFNACVAPLSDVKDTATKLLAEFSCQHDRLEYHPGRDPGTLILEGQRCWNVHAPGVVKAIAGDVAPWLAYLNHMFPDEGERQQVMKWLATLIARPDIGLRYGLLLISEKQGVGKNTLANILSPILGHDNVSWPNEKMVVESQFNDWLARKRLIFIGEIYSGSSRAAYDKMKSIITDDRLPINEKNDKPYYLQIWATVIACSNSMAALHLDGEDRRWLVPTVAEVVPSTEWFEQLYAWVRGDGAGIVVKWAKDFVAGGDFVRTGDRAPWSTRKQTIVEASRSEGQQLAVSLAEHLVGLPGRTILRVGDIRRWIALQRGFERQGDPDLGHRHLESAKTIITAMRKVDGICVWADDLRPKFGATREAVVMNFTPEEGQRWPEIKSNLTTIQGMNLDDEF